MRGSQEKEVSIVAVIREVREVVFDYLLRALSQPFVREIVIFNLTQSAVFDRALLVFARLYPRCVVVPLSGRYSVVAAYNVAAQYTSGNFLLFWNTASPLPQGVVSRLLRVGRCKPHPWVVGFEGAMSEPALLPLRWKKYLSRSFYQVARLPCFQEYNLEKEVTLPGGGIPTAMIDKACFLLPMQTFSELKGFDVRCGDATFHLDLCLRVHLQGGEVYRLKEAFPQKPCVSLSSVTAWTRVVRQWWEWCYCYRKYWREEVPRLLRYVSLCLFAIVLGPSLCKRDVQGIKKRYFSRKGTLKIPVPRILVKRAN